MSSPKRSPTIENFFRKKQKQNKHDAASAAPCDSSNSIHLQTDNLTNIDVNVLTRNSQATTEPNISIDTNVILNCIEDTILNVDNNFDNNHSLATGMICFFHTVPQFDKLLFIFC
jgi:hypothetical protein